MQVKTLVGCSLLSMLLSSLGVIWLTSPTATAAASPVTTPAPSRETQTQLSLPGLVELDARVGHSKLSTGGSTETYLLFRARPGATRARPPLDLALLIDHSGSMRGRRLDNALSSARALINRLADGDRISVISYDSGVTTLIPSTRIDADSRKRVSASLDSVVAKGNTCISCALEAGMAALAGSGVKQIVLLSDGEATAGVKTLDGFQALARRAREAGIGLSSIGVDVDYNEALLSTLARLSNGRHHFVKNPGDLEQAFDRELSALSGSVVTNASLELTLPSDVELVNVFDREVEREGNRLTVRLGSFTEGDEKTFLVKVRVAPGGARQLELARFAFQYEPSGQAQQPMRVTGGLGVDLADGPDSELDPTVAARIGKSRTGALLFEAGKLFSSGEPSDFQKLDQRFAGEIRRVEAAQTKARGADRRGLEQEKQVLAKSRQLLITTRGGHCGCAANDLQCAMSCSSRGKKPKPANRSCQPGDPLCANLGDLSSDEKAAAKESVTSSIPFRE
jgi:Ca-activated chloride channel family protein